MGKSKRSSESFPRIGKAWIKNGWKDILSHRKITRGKDKGKFLVTYIKVARATVPETAVKINGKPTS